MSVHEFDVEAGQAVGDGDRLLRVADIVLDIELDLLAVDAARRVDRLDAGLGAVLELLADGRDRPGEGSGNRNGDVLSARRRPCKAEPCSDRRGKPGSYDSPHPVLPSKRCWCRLAPFWA